MTQTQSSSGKPGTRGPSRLESSGSVKLTGRGAVLALFAACLSGLLIAAWTGWTALADAMFLIICGVVAYYTRAKGLRHVVVSPPLAFLAATVCAELITVPGTFLAAEQTMVTLGASAPWLFTGTALTIVIAVGRGYRPERPASWSAPPMITNLTAAVRDALHSRSGVQDRKRLARPAWSELAAV
ncbi:MAG: hypothetical protein M3Z75_26370 [Actinomycetota bacterium]|nr:hypothetical protein [Actinomycetota bacterium]